MVEDGPDHLRYRIDRLSDPIYHHQPALGEDAGIAERADGTASRWAAMIPILDEIEPRNALDIGCNSGWFVIALAARGIPQRRGGMRPARLPEGDLRGPQERSSGRHRDPPDARRRGHGGAAARRRVRALPVRLAPHRQGRRSERGEPDPDWTSGRSTPTWRRCCGATCPARTSIVDSFAEIRRPERVYDLVVVDNPIWPDEHFTILPDVFRSSRTPPSSCWSWSRGPTRSRAAGTPT
jgi:hypothetical protein